MKLFKNAANQVFAFEQDGSQDDLISDDLVPISTAEADALRNPVPTDAQLIALYEGDLDLHLDTVARAHRYNDRFTFALRAGYPGPYQAEGIAFAQWMDDCNAQAYALLAAVEAGTAPLPSRTDFIAGLPALVLP